MVSKSPPLQMMLLRFIFRNNKPSPTFQIILGGQILKHGITMSKGKGHFSYALDMNCKGLYQLTRPSKDNSVPS